MFGMLIVAFSIYHSTFVPNEFKSTEIDHNEKVQGDLLQLSDKIRGTATNGVDSSQTVSYGGRYDVWTAYPSPILYGVTRTPQGKVTFDGVTVTDNEESNDYWDTQRDFSTKFIKYTPAYRQYQNPPVTVIEHGNVYNDFGGEQLDLNSQDIVSDDSVNLILIHGDLNESSDGSERVSINSVSSSDSTTQIDGDFTFTIPTDRDESYWVDELDEPMVDGYDYRGDEIQITINSANPISLRITRVSLESESNSAEYITIENSVVTVKDKYGNPIGGTEVMVDETGNTHFSNDDGTVDIPDPTQTIHPYIYSNSSDQEFVTVEPGDTSNQNPDSSPTINDISLGGESGNKYSVDYDVSDPDGTLESIRFELYDTDGSQITEIFDDTISGSSAVGNSGNLNYRGSDDPDKIVVTVKDGGNTVTSEIIL